MISKLSAIWNNFFLLCFSYRTLEMVTYCVQGVSQDVQAGKLYSRPQASSDQGLALVCHWAPVPNSGHGPKWKLCKQVLNEWMNRDCILTASDVELIVWILRVLILHYLTMGSPVSGRWPPIQNRLMMICLMKK